MATHVDASYEGGVLRPVEPLALAEQERVTITVEPLDDLSDLIDHEYMAQCQASAAKRGNPAPPSIQEMQDHLKDVPGSFADLIVEERGHSWPPSPSQISSMPWTARIE